MSEQTADVCRTLGIEVKRGVDPDMLLARRLQKGLHVRAVTRVASALAPDEKAFAFKVVPRASLIRYRKKGRLSAAASDKVYDLGRVWVAAERLYGDEDQARAFLHRPHPLLQGETPLELARASSAGADMVLALIHRAAAGVAA